MWYSDGVSGVGDCVCNHAGGDVGCDSGSTFSVLTAEAALFSI